MTTDFSNIKTLVVKIGTTLLSSGDGFEEGLLEAVIKDLALEKKQRGLRLLIVSSGAMGCGMEVLGMRDRPTLLPAKQATAAVGQSRLMHFYEDLFRKHGDGLKAAQVLLSTSDLDRRESYLNVRNTLAALFEFGDVVPIINENDSTATQEIRFGDNDTLAAKIASKINADLLIILSNVDGLYEQDPNVHPDAKLIEHVEEITPEIETLAGDTRAAVSIGGMCTKLAAAKIACSTGIPTVIANGHRPKIISNILAQVGPMTVFNAPSSNGMSQRKRWIAFGRSPQGSLEIDEGARKALVDRGKSLLAAGIVSVEGKFEMGEAVDVKDSNGRQVARGLINYSRQEVDSIKGRRSGDIEEILGYKDYDEVIHRDNLVIL